MNKTAHRKALNFMRLHADDHREFGELSCTSLAEATAHALDLHEGDDVPEWVFDLAVEVDEEV